MFQMKIILITILYSLNAFAENHMTIMGAGGEPKDMESTIFDVNIPVLSKFPKEAGWKTTINYNGGHKKTEKLLKKHFDDNGIKSQPFTESSYRETILNYMDQINSGEIKSGDQLLVVLDSHGSSAMGNTHRISTSEEALKNLEKLGGSSVSVDTLQPLIDLANSKGIKLAILDTSCHSGNTLNLANDKTCIISAAGPDHYSYGGKGFTYSILKNFEKGKTLEDIFIKTLEENTDASFPMISTPAGLEINTLLYKKITPFLHFYLDDEDKFTKQLKQRALEDQVCSEDIMGLVNIANEVAVFQTVAKKNYTQKRAQKLNEVLNEYLAMQEKLSKKLVSSGYPELTREEEVCTGDFCMTYTVEEMLKADFKALKKMYEALLVEHKDSRYMVRYSQSSLENIKKFEEKKMALLKSNPKLKKASQFFDRQFLLQLRTLNHATNVTEELNHLYLALYKEKTTQGSKPNPCRDFKL